MPRKRKSEGEGKKVQRRDERKFDVEELFDEYLDELVDGLGLSNINLPREFYYNVLKEPFIGAVGDVKSKPKPRTIINRLISIKADLFHVISVRLARELDHLSPEQLDFAVQYIRRGIVEAAPKLYQEAIRMGARETLELLKETWKVYGIKAPVNCPRCGFASVMPDGVCMVCGKDVSDGEIKRQLEIIEQLRELKEEDPVAYNEIMSTNYLYFVEGRLVPPSKVRQEEGKLRYEIVLTKKDKMELEKDFN